MKLAVGETAEVMRKVRGGGNCKGSQGRLSARHEKVASAANFGWVSGWGVRRGIAGLILCGSRGQLGDPSRRTTMVVAACGLCPQGSQDYRVSTVPQQGFLREVWGLEKARQRTKKGRRKRERKKDKYHSLCSLASFL